MTGDRATVLFVCSGNICRSPYAEVVAASMLDADRFAVASAGTIAMTGLEATDTMQDIAADKGLDLSEHRSRLLDDVPEPDWVIGMEQHHLVAARSAFPGLDPARIRLLDHPRAVPDPYGRGRAVYESATSQIDAAVEHLVTVLG